MPLPNVFRAGSDWLAGTLSSIGGRSAFIQGVQMVDGSGNPTAQIPVALASNVAIGANTGTTPVTGVRGGVYVWDAQFTGTGPLVLQALGADGITWRNVATLNASSTFSGEVRIGANATLRLFSTTALTAVSSTIS